MRLIGALTLLLCLPAMAQISENQPNEIYAQLDSQNQTIAELTQKVEELTHAQDVLNEKLAHLEADIEIRFKEQERSSSVAPVAPLNTTGEKTDKEAYEEAYQLLVKSKYADAENAFKQFLQNYPKSSLVGNANYWLGETYYVRGQYEYAAGVFSDGLTKYEKSTKAPDNLLKLGLTMENLKKKQEACSFFKLLPQKYPKAGDTLIQRAKQEAKKLQCP